jgi:hypothetical protein
MTLFVSPQVDVDPLTRKAVKGTEKATHQCSSTAEEALTSRWASLDNIVMVDVLMTII